MLRCRCDLRFRRPLQCRVIFFTDRILSLTLCFGKIFFHRKPDCPITRCLIKFFLSPETGMPHSPPFRNVFSAGNRNAPKPAVPKPGCLIMCHSDGLLFQRKNNTEFRGGGVHRGIQLEPAPAVPCNDGYAAATGDVPDGLLLTDSCRH